MTFMDIDKLIIRNERPQDYRAVEELTREAFWNLYIPGCVEHYLVHRLRTSEDFLPELDLVALYDGRIVGNIVFTKSRIVDSDGNRYDTITFGPVSVLPDYQNQGIGKALIGTARKKACDSGYRAILIYGYPEYYSRLGFKNAGEFGISDPEGRYPVAHLALELYGGALKGITGRAYESEMFNVPEEAADEFDKLFEPKEKKVTESQKRFEETASSYLESE